MFEFLGIPKIFQLSFVLSSLSVFILFNLKEAKIEEGKNIKFNIAPYKTLLKDRKLFPVYLIASRALKGMWKKAFNGLRN